MRRTFLSTVSALARPWLCPALCMLMLGLMSACASPYSERPADAPFGQSVRSALKAQEAPPSQTKPVAGVPYTEIEAALDRQQKAKPIESTQNRGNTPSGLGLMGP